MTQSSSSLSDRNLSGIDVPAAPSTAVTVSVLLMAATTIMANATIAPSLPAIRAHFANVNGIDTLAGLVITLPSLAVVLTAGVIGWIADRFDRQKVLLGAGLLYAMGGTSGLWVDGLPGMLVGRLVLGIGVAGMMVLATTWAADLWVGGARARFLGLQGAIMSAGGIFVVLVGGALATLHWRGAFATYLLVLPIMALALRTLAPFSKTRARADRIASAVDERLPLRAFALVGSLGLTFMAIVYVMPTRLPFLLAERGVSHPLVVAMVMSMSTVFAIPGALLYGRMRQRLSMMAIFAASWTLMGSGMLVLATTQSLPAMIAGVALIGVGIGPSLPNYTNYWLNVVPPALRGRAAGMLTTAFFAGQFVSPLVTAPLVGALGLAGAFEVLAIAQLVLACVLAVSAVRAKQPLRTAAI